MPAQVAGVKPHLVVVVEQENLIFHKASLLELTVLLVGEDDDLLHPKPRFALWSRGSGMLSHDILHAAGPMMERSPFLVHLRIF